MNYELIDNITAADIAVRVKAPTLELLFRYGAEALMSEMMENVSSIHHTLSKKGEIEGQDLPLLFFEFLNEFLFLKDSESTLFMPDKIEITESEGNYKCCYSLTGEKIDRENHRFRVDIKAVTLHALRIYKERELFVAESVFDV